MRPQEIIAKKRDGVRLNEAEIEAFIRGVTDGSWADYQITALIMAMYLNELDFSEQSLITRAMLYSGEVLEFPEIHLPIVDKHSTGGVGDKTSLIVAPIAAACGLAVPMISGRGLGHTGGTLDKLESIPGYNVNLPVERFKAIVAECGFAMSGQTAQIAPADKKIYALRDATATVPTIPLIVASIMSKKLAEGLDALVLDVKAGNGAFTVDLESARRLAGEMVKTGNAFNVHTRALITDMSQPLGQYVGNALEVYECIKLLKGEGSPEMSRSMELSKELSAHMLVLAGVSSGHDAAMMKVEGAIKSGKAFEKFTQNVEMQGGDPAVCDDPESLIDNGLEVREIKARETGYVNAIDTLAIGDIVSEIGGGRIRAEDTIDPKVGFSNDTGIGAKVSEGDRLGTVFCRTASAAGSAVEKLTSAYTISETPAEEPGLVVEIVR
jgi:pyrimidine-nucleoside phosphorylase